MSRRVPLAPPWIRWAVVAVTATGIVAASVSRGGPARQLTGPLGAVGLDKYLHAIAFGAFALALAYALASWPSRRVAIAVFVGTIAFGFAVELLQLPLPYRTFSWLDLVADGAGAVVVAGSWRAVADRVRFRPVEVEIPVVGS